MIPLLVLILICTFEAGRALTAHNALVHFAGEAARSAALLPGIEKNRIVREVDPALLQDCLETIDLGRYEARLDCPFHLAHERIAVMRSNYGKMSHFTLKSVEVSSAESGDRLEVSIEAEYHSLFSFFNGIVLSTSTSTPYMRSDGRSSARKGRWH